MEKTHSRECHGNTVLIAALDYDIVADRAAGLCNILNAGLLRSLDIIAEGEEGVGAEGYAVNGVKICALFLVGERLRLYCEILFPVAVSAYVLFVSVDIAVDNVIAVRSLDIVLEGEGEDLIVLSEEPGISLAACKTGAMNSGLLTCSYADSLSVYCKANGVGLSILESDKSDDKIANGTLGKILILCYDICEKGAIYLEVISALLKGDTEYLLMLNGSGNVIGIDLNDIIAALSLGLEDLKCLGLVAGSDDTVGYLALDKTCRSYVANVGKSYPVAKGAHSVSAAGSCISASEGRLIKSLDIVYKASLLELFGKDSTYGSACGAYVLEGGYCGKARSLLQLLYKLPGVECIKEVDISGATAKNFDGKLRAVRHIDLGRLLIGVTTVFKFKFFHFQLPLCVITCFC